MNDPILNRFGVYLHRVLLFAFLWLLAFLALGYKAFDGAARTWRDWWDLFTVLTGSNCPSATLHTLEFIAGVSILPVILIFWIISWWWRGQGMDSLRVKSGLVDK
jgi:hypothetical protein